MPSLVLIGPVILEKKIFKYFQFNFTISLLSPLGKGHGPSFPLHSKMLCAKFGSNWPTGSREEVENVKSLRTDRQTTDNMRSEKLT